MGESERAADSAGDDETAEVGESAPATAESTAAATESTSKVAEATAAATAPTSAPTGQPPSLGSRILVTWVSLAAVGVIGGFLSSALSGPVGFIVFLATSLAFVAVLLYNVNELVRDWIAATQPGATAD